MIKCYLLLLFLWSFSINAIAFAPCRISGYPHPIDCEKMQILSPVSHQEMMDVTVYKVAARVRYAKASPLFWIPESIAFKSTRRAPYIIQSLSRIRNSRDLYWIEFTPNPQKMHGDCLSSPPYQSINFRLDRYANPRYLSGCQKQFNHFGKLDEITPDTLADYYETVVKRLNIKNVTIFAERSGGEIANMWHLKAPSRILFQVFDNPDDAYKKKHLTAIITATISQLNMISGRCVKSGQCKPNYSGLIKDLLELSDKLPAKFTVKNPYSFSDESIIFSHSFFVAGLLNMLQSPEQAQWLPALIQHANRGDWLPFYHQFARSLDRDIGNVNYSLLLAKHCTDWNAFEDKGAINEKKIPDTNNNPHEKLFFAWMFHQITRQGQNLCANIPNSTDQQVAILKSIKSPPQLIMSGMYPQSQLRHQQESNTLTLNSENIGATSINVGCAKDVISRYFNQMDRVLSGDSKNPLTVNSIDADCLIHIPPPLKITIS